MWVHVPSTHCQSAPEAADSISASVWRSQMLERSVTWREKHSLSRYWLQRWKRGGWMTRLFGRIYEPSTASLGVESWIASLAESRASLTQSRESARAKTTSETSGPTPQELFKMSGPQSSFLRMFPESWDITTNELGETYDEWATRLRKDYSRRLKSAQATNDNGSSYWPTARAQEPGTTREDYGDGLGELAQMWPTPTQRDHKDGTSADTVEENALLVRAAPLSSLHSETTTTDGHVCSPKCRLLNPHFVSMHMNLPIGLTNFDYSGMESYRRQQRWHFTRLLEGRG